jgi:GWxTD domain-containing protein
MRAAAWPAAARASASSRGSATAFALALALGPARPTATAQVPTLPFADSIAAIRDTAALASLERQLIAWAREHRDNPDIHLRLGAIALRLGELAGQPYWDHAISEFEWAAELDPRSPLPWYGLGLAWTGMAPEQYDPRTTVQAMLGRDPIAVAARAFREALERDPTFAAAAVAWGRLAVLPALRDEAPAALAALRALPSGASDSTVHLVRGWLERRAGVPDSALAGFARYAGAGGSTALARLERARVLLAAGLPGGAAAYYEGAALADSLTIRQYRTDLAFIAADSVLAGFDSAHGAARRRWLERFWRARDLAAVRSDGERLAEHYRRLEQARRDFALPPFKRRFGFEEYYQSGRSDIDDRGVIFVRHGEPTDRNRSVRFQAESWYYAPGTEAELIFHFVATDDLADYRLVPSPAMVAVEAREELREQGGPASDQYWRLATIGRAARPRLEQRFFDQGRELMEVGTSTDSWGRRWAEPLEAGAQAVATGVPAGAGHVHVAVAVPIEALTVAGEGRPEVTVRLAAWTLDGTPAGRIDTLVAIPAGAGDRTGLVRLSLPVPSGPVLVVVVAEAGDDSGALVLRDTLQVPDADVPLGLSDLVLGRESIGLSWTAADGEPVALNPLGGFPRTEPMALYYEIYGLANDLASTEVVLWRARDGVAAPPPGQRGTLRVRFEERGAGAVTYTRRTVDLGELEPGAYRLRLTVRDGDGREAVRAVTLVVTRR